jgi:hypothetical protein
MKVDIGPYVPWWYSRIHTEYMNKKYGYDWDESNTFFEKALEKLEGAINTFYQYTFNRIFGQMKRKIKVRVDDYDVWGLDNTLAHIILPALKLLKVKKHGTPFTDREDAPEDSIYNDEKDDEGRDAGYSEKRWHYIIDEMIHTFECEVNDDWEDQFYSGEHHMITVPETLPNGESVITWVKGPNDTFKADYDAMEKAWERRRNGLRLFAKYYHSLWD